MTCRILTAAQLPESIKQDGIFEDDERNYLVVEHNGKVISYASDGGEPEDNTFRRDYSWIKPLIEKVYNLGLKDSDNGLQS